jgi:HEPN domain-containing protein
MQSDPILVEDTRAWFRRVAVDLRSADAAFAATPPVLEDIVFHCQQAAEKAMKGFLTWRQSDFGKTHDLRELGRACSQLDAGLAPLMERAMPLTRYAWKFRYPGDQEEPSPEEARQALALAREVAGALLDRLPGEVRP